MNIEHVDEENKEDEESEDNVVVPMQDRELDNTDETSNSSNTSSEGNFESIGSDISSQSSLVEISSLSDLLSSNVENFINEISHYFPHESKKLFRYENLNYKVLSVENNSSKPDNPNLLRYLINAIQFIKRDKKIIKKEIIHTTTGFFVEGESTIVFIIIIII